jgi:hypothetical protein
MASDEATFGGNALLRTSARALGLIPSGSSGVGRMSAASAAVTWVPLVILTALDGTLSSGPTIPFGQSYGTHARLLLAIPLFFLTAHVFRERAAEVRRRLLEAELVAPSDRTRFAQAWETASRAWNSRIMGVLLAVVTLASVFFGIRVDVTPGISTWRNSLDGNLSPAGWWYSVVSLPFFQFLLLRWAWRLAVWGHLLWRISRLDLVLLPAHPDKAGGLGSLGVAHVDLSPLAFACSGMMAATFAEQLAFGGTQLPELAVPAVSLVLGLTAALIAPLTVFSPRLLEVKQRGLLEYGVLASHYARGFDAKWLRGGARQDEPILGTADIQSLADLSNSFQIMVDMRILPIRMSQIIMLAMSAAAPLLPLVLFVFPLDELIISGVRSLVGI